MSYKIVRNASGEVICFGPNTDHYQPGIPPGAALTVESSRPAKTSSEVAPTSVTMRQARLALLGAGMLPSVNAALEAMAGIDGDAARIEWEYAATVERNSPLVSGLSAALSLTSEQLDQLFTTAKTL